MNKYSGIYEEANGNFRVVSKVKTKDGHMVTISKRGFFNKTDALKFKLSESEAIRTSYFFQQNNYNINLHDYFNLYLDDYKLEVVESTFNAANYRINKYLIPNLPNKPMNELKPSHFASFKRFIASSNEITSNTKNDILDLVKRILKRAVDKNYLDNALFNICNQELTKVVSDISDYEAKCWEYDEFLRFVNSFDKDDPYRLLFKTLFFTGCRLGEFRGLKWIDLDSLNNTIHICRQVTSKLRKKTWIILPRTKTKRDRYTTIPTTLTQELLEFKRKHNFSDECFIFFGASPISENAIRNMLNKHCALSGVKRIRIHDFRHSYITYLIDKGIDLKMVARQVGHTNVATTLNVYNHITAKRQGELDKLFDTVKM